MSKTIIIPGEYSMNPDMPQYAQHAIPGTFPRRYWDIITYDDEEELAAYLNGQESFIEGDETPAPTPAPVHRCKRCQRPCNVRYAYCYRCNNYLKVKARIA